MTQMPGAAPDWHARADKLRLPTRAVIDGACVDAASGRTFTRINPATGRPLATVAECEAPDVDRAVQAARRTFEHGDWRGLGPSARKDAMLKWARLIEAHAEEIALLESVEIGKPITDTLNADAVACAAPIGLFFGRIANFINGELYGRPTDVAWGMVFPRGGPVPRHPSQLYEAVLEGLVLFLILYGLWRVKAVRERPGILFGVFLAGYGVMRSIAELFRAPDAHIGYLWGGLTMGQVLSVPMIVIGAAVITWAARRPVAET